MILRKSERRKIELKIKLNKRIISLYESGIDLNLIKFLLKDIVSNSQIDIWIEVSIKKENNLKLKTTTMKILTEGHKYELKGFENPTNTQEIQFIEKKPEVPGGTKLKTVNDGTTNEALLEVLINRMKYQQNRFQCKENAFVIANLEESLMWLEKRTEDREKRHVEGSHAK